MKIPSHITVASIEDPHGLMFENYTFTIVVKGCPGFLYSSGAYPSSSDALDAGKAVVAAMLKLTQPKKGS